MNLFIESNLAYNEFIQEMQMIDLSILLEDENGGTAYEVNHNFDLVFGIDDNLIKWLGLPKANKSDSKWKETLEDEIKKLNDMIDKDVVIVMWNDITAYLKDFNYKNYYIVNKVFTDNKPLKHVAKVVLKEDDLGNDSKSRLTATRKIYKMIKENNKERSEA